MCIDGICVHIQIAPSGFYFYFLHMFLPIFPKKEWAKKQKPTYFRGPNGFLISSITK